LELMKAMPEGELRVKGFSISADFIM
jgi:hypothetical protein